MNGSDFAFRYNILVESDIMSSRQTTDNSHLETGQDSRSLKYKNKALHSL